MGVLSFITAAGSFFKNPGGSQVQTTDFDVDFTDTESQEQKETTFQYIIITIILIGIFGGTFFYLRKKV